MELRYTRSFGNAGGTFAMGHGTGSVGKLRGLLCNGTHTV